MLREHDRRDPPRARRDPARLRPGAARRRGAGHPRPVAGHLAAVAAWSTLGDRRATYWAGRATLCGWPDDLDPLRPGLRRLLLARTDCRAAAPAPQPPSCGRPRCPTDERDGAGPTTTPRTWSGAMASAAEVLRHRDVAEPHRRPRSAALAAMFATLHPRAAAAPSRPATAWRRGEVDARRTLRDHAAPDGRARPVEWRRRGTRPRRVVLLVDVSGSMSTYADALLRLAHRFAVDAPAAAAAWRCSRSAPGSPTSPGRCGSATPSGR